MISLALAFLAAVLAIVAGAVALYRRRHPSTTLTVTRGHLFRAGDRIDVGDRRGRVVSVVGTTITYR